MARDRGLTDFGAAAMKRGCLHAVMLAGGLGCAAPAAAQSAPFSDTEDASLGDVSVGSGDLHPIVRLDLRNGDYARGSFDDDASNLDRLPVHAQLGLVYDLRHAKDGAADVWLEVQSSNGFHAPARDERTAPRSWYESNNLLGLVAEPTKGLRAAVTYTIKTNPNGISSTTHEASVATSYESDHGIGWLHPNVAATIRTKGDHGLYTQAGIEPEFDLRRGDGGPRISVPIVAGIGWGGFYQAGTGDVVYGSAGLAYTQPFTVGATKWSARAEVSALVRDRALARLDGADANRATVVPIGQLTLALAY